MRIFSLSAAIFAALLIARAPARAGDAASDHSPGTSVEMPYLIAPVVVNGTLVANAYIMTKIITTSPAATITVRERLPFIQDAYVRDVNATPIGKPSDPATVDGPALAVRLLADARRIVGRDRVMTVDIYRIQNVQLHIRAH
ncbi:MAG: hypothetical protein ACLQUZ_03365 [Rhizomicrobium sp.]